jgi:hypothetical protein
MNSQLPQKIVYHRADDNREAMLSRIDSDDARKNWFFTVTITSVIAIAFWIVLINPFNSYLPEAFLAVACITLMVISYLNKRELGLSSLGHLAYVMGCILVGLGLIFGLYVSSAGESLEQAVLLQTFDKHQETFSVEQLDVLKTQSNNLIALRTITINLD